MARKILVYGHGDKSVVGFPTEGALVQYLEGGIFQEKGGRYRYSQKKPADVVVLARDGKAYGHFEIDDAVAPTAADREAYPPVKKVYLVRKSVRYANAVALAPLGISNYRFGQHLDEDELAQLHTMAGDTEEFHGRSQGPLTSG
jgi:hypothetical protein